MANDLSLGDLKITLATENDEPAKAEFELPDGSVVTRFFPGSGELTMRLGLGLTLAHRAMAPDEPAEATEPAQFQDADWSVSDNTTGGDITVSISALPSDGGSPITDLEYQIDGGAWVSLGGTTVGDYVVSGLTDDVQVAVAIRAVNAVGAGTASATKAVTPTTAATGFGSHRYWRLYVTATEAGGNVTQLSEVELIGSGGTDLTGTGTASASSVFAAGFEADKAFDNSPTTNWASINTVGSIPAWLKYDFGAGNAVEVEKIAIQAYDLTTGATAANVRLAPKDFKLQYSDDDSTWVDAITVTGEVNWGVRQKRTYDINGNLGGTKRLWRINVTANNSGNQTIIRELELRQTSGGADETGSGLATGDSHNNTSFSPAQAFDNGTTPWSSQNLAGGHWVAYDFGIGVSKDITEIVMTAEAANQAPRDFDIQYSDDGGKTYTTSWSVTGSTGWAAGTVRTFTKP